MALANVTSFGTVTIKPVIAIGIGGALGIDEIEYATPGCNNAEKQADEGKDYRGLADHLS